MRSDLLRSGRSQRITLPHPTCGQVISSVPSLARIRPRPRGKFDCFYFLTQDGGWYNVNKWPRYFQSRNSDPTIMSLVYRVSGPNAVRVFGGSHHEGEFLYPSS